MTTAYPLAWPQGFKRTQYPSASKFKTTLPAAINNVHSSLKLFAKDSGKALDNIIISSNVTLGAERPKDAGVAVYFSWDGMTICIPVDKYSSIAENLQAIHHIIEARRVELRHGTLALVRASFQGFRALAAPTGTRSWRDVLGLVAVPLINISAATIENAYRSRARAAHPDTGGSAAAMSELNVARDNALKEIGP